jgi:molecular chaperone GrpE
MTHPMKHDDDSDQPENQAFDPALSSEEDEAIDVGFNRTVDDEKEQQIAELRDQLMRALAETENVRKRAQRDVEEANKYAVTGFARHLVSVLENLQRATQSIPGELRASNPAVKNLSDGVEMTQRELLTVFEKFGIRRIDPVNEKFDHNFHQAMTQIADDKVEPGTILQVLQAGYVLHDRLLQPALVAVAKRSEAPAQVDTQA